MNPDLKGRMNRGGMKERRKYCDDCQNSQNTDDSFRICGNNGIMYPNECVFACSKSRMPGKMYNLKLLVFSFSIFSKNLLNTFLALQEAEDYGICGPISFTEFKVEKFKSHY